MEARTGQYSPKAKLRSDCTKPRLTMPSISPKRKYSALPITDEELRATPYDSQLFVGNLPHGLDHRNDIHRLVSDKIRQLGLWHEPEDPVLGAIINWPYSFVYLRGPELTTRCLQLDKTPCEERFLTVARPKSYTKPNEDEQQQVRTKSKTMKRLKYNDSGELSGFADISYDRQLHVSNIPTVLQTNRHLLKDFFCKKIRELGLWNGYLQPVLEAQMLRKSVAVLSFQSEALTTDCLRLDQIEYLSQKLTVERPLKWKEARILFVGNVSPEMTEDRLREFLFNTMKITGMLAGTHKSPIENIKIFPGHAFVVFTTARAAVQALHLHNIPFLGEQLRLKRPTWWKEAPEKIKDWRHALRDHEETLHEFDRARVGMHDSLDRQIVIRKLPSAKKYSDALLVDFLSSAMEQVGLNLYKGKALKGFKLSRTSGSLGEVEFRCPEEATQSLQLNRIPFEGHFLQLERPPRWQGDRSQDDSIQNWDKALSNFFATRILSLEEERERQYSSPTPPLSNDDDGSLSNSNHDSSLQGLRKEVVEAKNTILQLQLGSDESQKELADLKQLLQTRDNELESLKEELEEARKPSRQLEEIEGKYKKMADRMADAMGELVSQQSSYRELQKERASERQKNKEAKAIIRQLEAELVDNRGGENGIQLCKVELVDGRENRRGENQKVIIVKKE
jgi:RNA recognition motif-containing protein